MKGLRRVIVSDALIAQVLSKGYQVDRPLVVAEGIPRGARLVNVEHPATEFGEPRPGSTAFVFEHESFPVQADGEVPTVVPIVRALAH